MLLSLPVAEVLDQESVAQSRPDEGAATGVIVNVGTWMNLTVKAEQRTEVS
jgi:hypothetical protein